MNSYLIGHFLALCPGFLQSPQGRLAGGLAVGDEGPGTHLGNSGFGVPERETGFGTAGRGHDFSLSGSGQKRCICSYKYHSLSADKLSFRSDIPIFTKSQRS